MPYALTSSDAANMLATALGDFGFDAAHMQRDTKALDAESLKGYLPGSAGGQGGVSGAALDKPITFDLVAFSSAARQDLHTSLISADFRCPRFPAGSRDSAARNFRLTAAPTSIVGKADLGKVDVWFNCHNGMHSAPLVDLRPDALQRVFAEHREGIQRESLASLREGQHHLFDRYLYAQRTDVAEFLNRGVSRAIELVPKKLWGRNEDEEAESLAMFSRVALALLAARILADKGSSGVSQSDPLATLRAARDQWDSFFDKAVDGDLPDLTRRIGASILTNSLDMVLAHLTGPIHFGLVTHEMLGDFYETALSADGGRIKMKGVHYTPYGITKQILDRIPVERLPVGNRRILDFACGSGQFLVAATDRLSALYNCREPNAPQSLQAHISESVWGNDIDPVAILVTKLSFMLAYGESKYDPELREGDATTLNVRERFGQLPSVIVSNPPFDGETRVRLFFEKALEILAEPMSFPRYLGIVMPQTLLVGGSQYRACRKSLLEKARLLEVWELPDKAVGLHAEEPTCVLIAEFAGAQSKGGAVRINQTHSRQLSSIKALRDAGIPTRSFVVSGDRCAEGTLSFSPIDDLWGRLRDQRRCLGRIADVCWGVVHTAKSGCKEPEFSEEPREGFVRMLCRQGALFPYALTNDDWISDGAVYWKKGSGWGPQESHWQEYESAKILISAQTNRNSRSQLIAAFDPSGIYPGKHFLVLTLKDGWQQEISSLYRCHLHSKKDILGWLCGLLNSPLGHAWFHRSRTPRGANRDTVKQFPLPARFCQRIAPTIERLETLPRSLTLRVQGTWSSEESATSESEFVTAVAQINGLVWDSYKCDAQARSKVMDYLRGMVGSSEPAHVPPANAHETRRRKLRGSVRGLDIAKQKVRLSLSWPSLGGGTEVSVPIPLFMPGWALASGQEFICMAPEDCTLRDLTRDMLSLRDFRPPPYGYLEIQGLESMVGYGAK